MAKAPLPTRTLVVRHLRALCVAAVVAAPLTVPGPALANPGAPEAEAPDGALAAFKDRHERIVAKVAKHASAASLQAEVDALLDYEWIAHAALGGQAKYEQACAPRCAEFEKLLTRLIRENYLRLVRKAEDHPVEYVGELKGRKGAVKVTTRIQVVKKGRSQKIEVAYVMHHTGSRWEVRDIITDGMSLAKTYRYEFNQVRKRDGIDGVIAKLETKLAEIAKMD